MITLSIIVQTGRFGFPEDVTATQPGYGRQLIYIGPVKGPEKASVKFALLCRTSLRSLVSSTMVYASSLQPARAGRVPYPRTLHLDAYPHRQMEIFPETAYLQPRGRVLAFRKPRPPHFFTRRQKFFFLSFRGIYNVITDDRGDRIDAFGMQSAVY
ncbi:hypothetical protein PYW08_009467 [Mythimna loreyi]|uniref:Uncharacterized protein n=1 Tax=Mythimna loreyi TaxID=667449 RepID=A0ACC2Q651_9NEOP|nr:hypothetical protein PYW08_009467 [Mythimna loreyi]